MIRETLPFVLLLGLFGCAEPNPQPNANPDAPAPAEPTLADARAKMMAGELDEALLIADALLAENPEDRAALLFRADGNLAMFSERRAGSEFLLDDAMRDLGLALELKDDDPKSWIKFSQCQYLKGQFEDGRESALYAASLLTASGAKSEEISAAFLQAADNEMQIFVGIRREEMAEGLVRPDDASTEAANYVLSLLKSAEQNGPVPQARLRTAQIYQWMGKGLDALQALEDGIRQLPGSTEMHETFQQSYWDKQQHKECVVAYKRLLKENRENSVMQWYLGRALVGLADSQRRDTRLEEADASYREAFAIFSKYDQERPSEHAVTGQWLAICHLSLGRIAFEKGQLDAAKQHYWQAYEASPLVAAYDENNYPRVVDSFGGNYLGGLSMIGQAIAEGSDATALRQSLEFYEEILQRHPNQFGIIYNNAALSARDLGEQLVRRAEAGSATERTAATEQALKLWEKSYRYYEQAIVLVPDDARIINDCGLMLIYHLRRDYERARALFDRAIQLGEAQLELLPPDVDAQVRNDLEEATGDAYQNIAVMMLDNLGRPGDEAKPFLERAVKLYPYQRRAATRMLRELEGKAPPSAAKARFEAAIPPAQAQAAAGDYDAALLVLDQMAKDEAIRRYAPFQHLYGLYSLRLAEASAASGGGAGLVDGLFQDAVRHLALAVELDAEPMQPRLDYAQALLATGDSQKAAEVATDLLGHMRSRGGAAEELLLATHLLRAQAASRAYIQQKQEGNENEELLRGARTSFRAIEETSVFSDEHRTLWITTEQWAGADDQAIEIAIRAWRRDPEQIGPMVDLGSATSTSATVIEALDGSEDALVMWWNGKAHFDQAQQLWYEGEIEQGIASLEEAVALFERSRRTNEDYAPSASQWIALCRGSQGLLLIANRDYERAEEAIFEAIRLRPDQFTIDLGAGSSIRTGLMKLVDYHYNSNQDLGKCAELCRRAGTLVPSDIDIANNEGLFSRDWGNQLEANGQKDAAMEFYEASYAAYTRASELDPGNVRLRNDRALILIYHLRRELDTAVEVLEEAIRLGETRLAEDPPSGSTELRALQEAVGDAYGNLGVHYINLGEPPAMADLEKARFNLEKSLDYYPYKRRAGSSLLKQVDAFEAQHQESEAGSGGEDR